MKKVLAIVVLGLLLSGNAYADPISAARHISDPAAKLYKVKGKHLGTVMIDSMNLCKRKSFYAKADPDGCLVDWIADTSEGWQRSMWEGSVEWYKGFKNPNKKNVETDNKKPKKIPDDDKILAAASGTGFFVTKDGHMVTNHHVIEGCNAVKANIKGKEIPADIIATDKKNDLAIIKANMSPNKVFSVSNEDVSLLENLIVAGFPLGKKVSAAIKTHKGSVTALAGFGDNYSNFQTDATINEGNSGGPIINQKGNVVGVAVALLPAEKAQNVFFGVKSSTLKTFAKSNNINFLPPNYRDMSNRDLGTLITGGTVFLECWMTVAKIKQMIAQAENRKAFYSEHK